MIYRDMELHNVSEVQETCLGAILQRFPAAVRGKLEKRRNFRAENCAGVEIRFASEAYCVEVVLKCLYGEGTITVFRGPHAVMTRYAAGGQDITLHLEPPEEWKNLSFGDNPGWTRNIWRIHLPPAQFAISHVEAYGSSLRPPQAGEWPARTLLLYGSSITQGCFAQNNSLSYGHYAAALLGWDIKNLGLSGACFCEKEAGEFLAEMDGWDAAVLELGANMRPFFTVEEFTKRAGHLIDAVCSRHPEKPVFLITIFPNIEAFKPGDTVLKEREWAYCRVLREMVRSGRHPGLFLVEGGEVLDQPGYLGADLLHPTDYGHIRMGENLAARLRPVLDGYQLL